MKKVKLNQQVNDIFIKNLLFGFDSEENAIQKDNFPYGKKFTKVRYWIESNGQGDRVITQTYSNDSSSWNEPSKGPYVKVALLTENEEDNIKPILLDFFSKSEEVERFVELFGDLNWNPIQRIRLGIEENKGSVNSTYDFLDELLLELSFEKDPSEAILPKEILEALDKIEDKKRLVNFLETPKAEILVDILGYSLGTFTVGFILISPQFKKWKASVPVIKPLLVVSKGDLVRFTDKEGNKKEGKIIKYSSNKDIVIELPFFEGSNYNENIIKDQIIEKL